MLDTVADNNTHRMSPWSQVTPVMELGGIAKGAVRRLGELARRPANWDGYGSPPLTMEAKSTAMTLLAAIGERLNGVNIVQVPGGGVQFEWGIGPRELELEILPDGSIQFLVVQGEQMLDGDIENRRTLEALLGWLWQS